MAASSSQFPTPGLEALTDNNQNVNTSILRELSRAVDGHAATATFACGGSIPISKVPSENLRPREQAPCPPVILRWDVYSYPSSISPKISFPLDECDGKSVEIFNALLQRCQPATFGVGGQDVLDMDYRNAGKLDSSEFATNFHPHDCGIVDSIDQILLPGTLKNPQGIGIGPQGVRAELYKLNVYSAPSGKFRSHVDTPRGAMQFGSLVVSLPSQHEGGTLRVKHRNQTIDFSWGNEDPKSIQWAAFYGDCEHEVLEVTKGHRITLTYNLYYSWIGQLARPVSDPHQLPLHSTVCTMLQQPEFMERGGTLGFFCHHQYAHSTKSGSRSIPAGFKGVDLAIYSVFTALGLKVGVHPIVQNKSGNLGGMPAKRLLQDQIYRDMKKHTGDYVQAFLDRLEENTTGSRDEESDPEYDEDAMEYDYIDYGALDGFGTLEDDDQGRPDWNTTVGTELHGPTFDPDEDYHKREPVTDEWPHQKVPQIVWMNEPLHKDFAHAGLAYGNQASLNYQFSAAAILVVVKPSAERIKTHPPQYGR